MSAEQFDIESIGAGGAELVRYRVSAGERVLMAWRRPGGVEVSDRPVEGRARGYLVDRGFRCAEQLTAFLRDYVAQATRIDDCPMSGEAIGAMLVGSEAEALEPLLGEEAGR